MKAQRLRFRYRVTSAAADLGHRDLVSAWENAVKAAGLTLSYSEGKRPSPQISLAAPPPRGVTSDAELVDVFLAEAAAPADALRRIREHFPPGLEPCQAWEVGVGAESAQASLRWAEYEIEVPAGERSEADVRRAIACFLASDSAPMEYRRESKVRKYDLRPLVRNVELTEVSEGTFTLWMRISAEQENTARADQVALALGFPETIRIHRKVLTLEEVPDVIQAFRRAGERET
jgi:radical SAM-linked protein